MVYFLRINDNKTIMYENESKCMLYSIIHALHITKMYECMIFLYMLYLKKNKHHSFKRNFAYMGITPPKSFISFIFNRREA